MDINERILAVGAGAGMNNIEFAQALGISQAVLSHLRAGRNKPGLELVLALLQRFPEINPEWMLFGKGEMKRPEQEMGQKQELLQLLQEIKLMNEMNFNALKSRIEGLEKRISGR